MKHSHGICLCFAIHPHTSFSAHVSLTSQPTPQSLATWFMFPEVLLGNFNKKCERCKVNSTCNWLESSYKCISCRVGEFSSYSDAAASEHFSWIQQNFSKFVTGKKSKQILTQSLKCSKVDTSARSCTFNFSSSFTYK